MEMRTRKQENKYGQALGYAWGRKDSTRDPKTLTVDASAFATFYAMLEEIAGYHQTLQDAFDYFRELRLEEQKAYGTSWARQPWSMYEAMQEMERNAR